MSDSEAQIDGVSEAFSTTDFDFTAYALTLRGEDGKRVARIADVKPFRRASGGGPGTRFAFQLVRVDGQECSKFFNNLLIKYTNGGCAVEPIVFVTGRKQLRVLIDQANIRARRDQRRDDYVTKQRTQRKR